MATLRNDWYGLVLRVDDRTADQVLRMGALYAPGRCYTDPAQVHHTLYHSPHMHGVDPEDLGFLNQFHSMAERIGRNGASMFSLGNVRVHGGRYLMWHLSVDPAVRACHQLAMDLLAPLVTLEHKEEMVRRVRVTNPNIRKRDLDLVRQYALEWVRWRNIPHLLCAHQPLGGLVIQSGVKHEYRGVFTALELTSHAPNGHIRETLLRLPIMPH